MNEIQKKIIEVTWPQLNIASGVLSEWADTDAVGPLLDGLSSGLRGRGNTRFRITIEEIEE
jgi:hypothetical protein